MSKERFHCKEVRILCRVTWENGLGAGGSVGSEGLLVFIGQAGRCESCRVCSGTRVLCHDLSWGVERQVWSHK